MRDKIKRTKNKKNKILAIEVALAAIPVKPKMAAISAMTKKVMDHESIYPPLKS